MRERLSMLRLALCLTAVAVFCSCWFSARPIYIENEKKVVEGAIAQLHDRMNAEQYDAIYDDMHPDFKAANNRQTILVSIKSNRDRMGKIESVKEHWLNYLTGDPVPVRAIYNLKCENGDFTEFFSYGMSPDGKPMLVQYQNFPGSSPAPASPSK